MRWDFVDIGAVPSVSNVSVEFDGPSGIGYVVLHFGQAVPRPRAHWGGWLSRESSALVEVLDTLGAPQRTPLVLDYRLIAAGPGCDEDTHFDSVMLDWPRGDSHTGALLPPGTDGAVVLVLHDLKGHVPFAALALNASKALAGLEGFLDSDHDGTVVLQEVGIAQDQARQPPAVWAMTIC
eukprot:m51a1_g1342 hypothetical protein (180) ;mRNA; f:326331-327060